MSFFIVLHFSFVVGCALGFGFQVYNISSKYFSYPTSTTTEIRMPHLLDSPAVSLCIRYGDFIKGPKGQWAYEMEDEERFEHLKTLSLKMTLKDIMEGTPPVHDLLVECMHRNPGSYRVIESNETDCDNLYKVTKFFIQEFICYRFEPVGHLEGEKYPYQNIAFSLRFPGLFYGLVLSKDSMQGANFCKVVVHGKTSLPYDSLAFSPTFYRVAQGEPKYNSVKVVYSFLETQLLPAPYTTNCRVYHSERASGNGGRKSCINHCVKNAVKELTGKFPFNTIENDTVAVEIVTDVDLDNYTFAKQLTTVEDECYSHCKQSACEDRFYLSVIQKEEKSEEDHLTIEVNAPNTPLFSVKNRELISVAGFFVYISTCFGTWFGLSFLSLNPKTLAEEFKQLGKKKDCEYCTPVKKFLEREILLLKTRVITQRLLMSHKLPWRVNRYQ
jgi:hypothetical protein